MAPGCRFAQNRGEANIGINKDSPITDDELIARFSVREAIERGKTMTILKKWHGGACEKLVYLQTSCRKGMEPKSLWQVIMRECRRSGVSSFIGNVAEGKRQQAGVLSYHCN